MRNAEGFAAGVHDGGRLLQLLPAIYRVAGERNAPGLRSLLAAFESLLLETPGERGAAASIADKIADMPELFRPTAEADAQDGQGGTPREFLAWLAQWVALAPRFSELLLEPASERNPESALATERAFRNALARIVPLYGMRGTRRFLEEALRLFIPEVVEVEIDDRDLPGLQVGGSALGKDTWLVTYRPFHFRIAVRFAGASGDAQGLRRRSRTLRRKAEAIIELSKPAHTAYDARWIFDDGVDADTDVDATG
jgi:hypothetical protein